jgi:EmrB/QacA subfamily drug resistance transporter
MTGTDVAPSTNRRRWATLVVVAAAVAMIILDATVVAVARPTLIQALHLQITTAEWLTTIYTVAFAAFLIPFGQLVDRIGVRRLFLTGVALFILGSAGAGLSNGAGMLLTARLIEGLSGALILPASLSTLNLLFTGRGRAPAFGVWGAVIGGMTALGPLVGGWLTTNAGWRWVFFVNVPIGVILAAAGAVLLSRERPTVLRSRFDLLGAALVTVALAATTLGLVQGQLYGWLVAIRETTIGPIHWSVGTPSMSVIAFAVAVVSMLIFGLRERDHASNGRPTYLAWALFDLRGFRYGNVTAAGVMFGEVGLIFMLPLFLQAALGMSAWQTGLVLSAVAVGAFVGGPIAGQVARRTGPRLVVIVGIVLLFLAIGGATVIMSATVTGVELMPWLGIAGLGIGAVQAQLSNIILEDVDPVESGQASGTQSTFRQLGSTFGIALVGTVLTLSLTSGVTSALASVSDISTAQVARITDELASSGGQALTTLRHDPSLTSAIAPIDRAFGDAARRSMMLALSGFGVAIVASLALPRQKETVSPGRHAAMSSPGTGSEDPEMSRQVQ